MTEVKRRKQRQAGSSGPVAAVSLWQLAADAGLSIEQASHDMAALIEAGWIKPVGINRWAITPPKRVT
ncbi:hypothetical protein ACIBTZ_28525 [Micromonospora sp. NPDC049460]|uniref:hypothetical protein n=1 Tax=Micromonospora sp. NPDC049460 TaxID=3364272 RepID=UPI0037B987F2